MNESTIAAATQTSPTQTSPDPASRNPVITRCITAWNSSVADSRARNLQHYDIKLHGTEAYYDAMPDLTG